MKEINSIPVEKTIRKIYDSLNWIQGLASDALHSSTMSVKLELDIQQEIPFNFDSESFEMVIENLVSNSIKYQDIVKENRFVRIIGKVDPDFLVFRISDNGIGIPNQYHDKIFEMYFRMPSKIYGSGMGLFIVKEIVERVGGSINVESELGLGTHFLVKIPNIKETA